MEENKQNLEEQEKLEDTTQTNFEKEDVSFSEKAEDFMDDVVGGIQDFMYGPKTSASEDIPATYEKPSGIRKINKVQTRKNIYRKIFGKKGAIIFCVLMIIAIIIGVIVSFVG